MSGNDGEGYSVVSGRFQDWSPVTGIHARPHEDGFLLTDDPIAGYHLFVLRDARLAGGRVRLKIVFAAAPTCDTALLVHQAGDIDILAVSGDGEVLHNWFDADVRVERQGDRFLLEAAYPSVADNVLLGTFRNGSTYVGTGVDQFWIGGVEAAVGTFAVTPVEERISFVDVGAAGGVHRRWLPYVERLDLTLVDAAAGEAAALRRIPYPRARVVNTALFSDHGERDLFLTRNGGCTSLLEPDHAVLARYTVAPLFEVVGRAAMSCARYDSLFDGDPPSPEYLKIDAQGVEHQVLEGFGTTLKDCLAVELEAHLVPIYRGEKLLGDLVGLLSGFGLYPRWFEPQDNFDGDLLEANVVFTRGLMELKDEQSRKKLQFIESVYGLERRLFSDVNAAVLS